MDFAPRGFLIDATGVLYDSVAGQDGVPIEGSISAIEKLQDLGVPFKILSNASTKTQEKLVAKLNNLGFNFSENDILSSLPMAKSFCKENDIRPACYVGKDIESYFADIHTLEKPNAVLMSFLDCGYGFSTMNEMLRCLIEMKEPHLITIGNGKYFKRTNGLNIDVGAYAAALKFATNCKHTVIGKPSKAYFDHGLQALDLPYDQVLMVGDDPVADIEGAQSQGIRAVQVRTGKYREDMKAAVQPFATHSNLKEVVDRFTNV